MPEAPISLFPSKPPKPKPVRYYRGSTTTMDQFLALPHAGQMALDQRITAAQGLTYSCHDHESGRSFIKAQRPKP